ncbi:MAG: hypothetical protein JJT89_04380 [Nitriliruptoraceae bacterium]|nr:hypothetical protein [Nitriliruptoraceae bacterium]
MAIPRDLVREVRRLDEFELRRLLILVRGLLLEVDGPPTPGELGLPPTLTYRQEEVRCGKPTCRSCPHGPYWYAYWREDGRVRKRYIGRQLPGEPLEQVEPDVGVPPSSGGDVPPSRSAEQERS